MSVAAIKRPFNDDLCDETNELEAKKLNLDENEEVEEIDDVIEGSKIEQNVGICQYLNPNKGFFGVIKQR